MPEEVRIRRYWRSYEPFDPLQDGFDRLSALTMLAEIDRLRVALHKIGGHDAGGDWFTAGIISIAREAVGEPSRRTERRPAEERRIGRHHR